MEMDIVEFSHKVEEVDHKYENSQIHNQINARGQIDQHRQNGVATTSKWRRQLISSILARRIPTR